MHLAARLGAQLRVAVFLLWMLFLILKAYMQRLWEMIAILFSINPLFFFLLMKGLELAGREFSICLQIFAQERASSVQDGLVTHVPTVSVLCSGKCGNEAGPLP